MTIKLWVDDIRPAPEGWHHAKTVTEAIRVLDEQDVEEVSLDHDISHDVLLNGIHRPYPCGETFEPVARFIRQLAIIGMTAPEKHYPKKVSIHTANPAGAERLFAILSPVSVLVGLLRKPGKPCNRWEAAP